MNPNVTEHYLGKHEEAVAAALADLSEQRIAERIWKKDHTVWDLQPTEISDRLGWLELPETMPEQAPALNAFADEIRNAGFRRVVVLGMGGSSLSSVTFSRTFGHRDGYPGLIVLDSTVPESVQAVTDAIDPVTTLFLVSSKSGTTMEPLLLYRYFRRLVNEVLGPEKAGRNFVAVTDPGTPLVELAGRDGFRRTFISPPDIGGRYSALSCFGLVPAALSGVHVEAVIEDARKMREACASCVPDSENPGVWLGACIGAFARLGLDKLTILASPQIRSFAIWVEQLIAESTGKNRSGIVPIVNEPALDVGHYSNDRLFIYLRLDSDDNRETDSLVERIKHAGRPLVVQAIAGKHEIGGEFFRWEFATAVAGAVLGVHPFDQPDVQSAKTATVRMIRQYSPSLNLLVEKPSDTMGHLVSSAKPGCYLAIMAYIHETPEVDAALQILRRMVTEQYHIPTTVGYGPRFLHSTGQLHKGGPDTGLFFQITSRHPKDVPVPGEPFTFGFVANAQASGDLEALQAAGRNVAWIHLDHGNAEDIQRLGSTLK